MRVLIISVITENLFMTVLPLGAAYIAAAAKDAGHDVLMLSLRSGREDYLKTLEETLGEFKPDVIGISLRNIDDQTMKDTSFLAAPVKNVVAVCKKIADAPVVLGGAGYSIFPQDALAYTGAEMGIRGEGEAAFAMLLEKLSSGKSPEGVPGLFLRGKDPLVPPKIPRDLDAYTMPLPGVHLEIPADDPDAPIWMPVQTRRGCAMDCSYCSTAAIEGRRLRRHSPDKVVQNLKAYVESGINHFFFVDNTFNFPPSYAASICDRIISEGLKIRSRCIVYPSRMDETLVRKMADAGFREISLGFESGSEKMLKAFNKRFSLDDIRHVSRLYKKYGIFQMGFLMLGGPGETRETVLESIRLVDELALDLVKVSVGVRIYPETLLAETAVREGKISCHDNLLMPAFYVKEDLEDWLHEMVGKWAQERGNWMV